MRSTGMGLASGMVRLLSRSAPIVGRSPTEVTHASACLRNGHRVAGEHWRGPRALPTLFSTASSTVPVGIHLRFVATAPMDTPPLSVLHEDADLLAVDKPAGLLVHPSALDAR